jgi:DMSO/TMAO reductase YedYZ molybdopterin-dependent catalytic subunit
MNHEDIPLDHGYPLRFISPGYIGVRNCKWVNKLIISDIEAQTPMQQRDYKIITEKDWSKFKFEEYPAVMFNVINSAIINPIDQSEI